MSQENTQERLEIIAKERGEMLNIKTSLKKIEAAKKVIALERDKIRYIASELSALIDSTDEGLDLLEQSLDSLSEYV